MQPLAYLINLIYYIIPNYGLSIIIFTIIIKAILFPFNLKGMKSSMRMQALQPKLKEIQEKYKDDKQKLVAEQQKLYKNESISPLAGCLPQIIPIIIMFGIYWVVTQPMTHILHLNDTQVQQEYYEPLRDASIAMQTADESSPGITAAGKSMTSVVTADKLTDANSADAVQLDDGNYIITNVSFDSLWAYYKNRQVDLINLAVEDGVIQSYPINFNFCGLNIAYSPSEMMGKNWWYLLFPLLAGISAWGSQKIMMYGMKFMQKDDKKKKKKGAKQEGEIEQKVENKADNMANSMNSVMKFMPILSAWIAFQFSSALGLYWMISNVTQILQQWYINESIRKPHAVKQELAVKTSKKG